MLERLNALDPAPCATLALCVLCALLSLFTLVGFGIGGFGFMQKKIRLESRPCFLESDSGATPFSRHQRCLAGTRQWQNQRMPLWHPARGARRRPRMAAGC
ncbi:MAG: hypothetical protein U1D36_19345 [Hydrogenophaga sp.]|uniref:hypothetical protein n=1 Tax=Hydrogenophaga sp. TaxID=1904254 RepID=UPI00272FF604|nr:hypothetical protein [Hydrogenophaga sp.]MDP2408464.1 hypothetical protein [Hydrogenophaga sp.]MDZ4176614.1 hypothetical protein [Hydrogenophaga sp.]